MNTPSFQETTKRLLEDPQLRRNVRETTAAWRERRAAAQPQSAEWAERRDAARAIRRSAFEGLDSYWAEFETNCTRAGGKVYRARDAEEANRIVVGVIQSHGQTEIVKSNSLLARETGLDAALAAAGIAAYETSFGDLVVQLAGDEPSHLASPAAHRDAADIQRILMGSLQLAEPPASPEDLQAAVRAYASACRARVTIGVTGASFALAAEGSVCAIAGEGNRPLTDLPEIVIALVGIENAIPSAADLGAFLQLVPGSSATHWAAGAETTRELHVVLLDNNRSRILADPVARETLFCIRCGACANVCPVYRQTGGHAYASPYCGPIGAILTPQLPNPANALALLEASCLCGACAEVCSMSIDIPGIRIHQRTQAVENGDSPLAERLAMDAAAAALSDGDRAAGIRRLARLGLLPFEHDGSVSNLPGALGAWTAFRDLPAIPKESFRDWWLRRPKRPD